MLTTRTRQTVGDATRRAEADYREMPGLSLTLGQAARLWGLDHATCARVLVALIDRRVLKRTATGAYVRRESSGS